MEFKEAKQILNESGYYLLETSTYIGFPFMRLLWNSILREKDKNENKFETHTFNPSKWLDVDFDDGTLRIYRTNTGIRGEFDNGRKFTYKSTGKNKWDAADECAKFIVSCVNGEISERKAKERLDFKESTQSSLSEELNKWNSLLNKMDNVKSHHYEIKGNNTIVEYTKVGVSSVWTFEQNGEDIDVVVDWPNRPEWQDWVKPVNFEYTLGYYEDYENDVKEFLTSAGKFH